MFMLHYCNCSAGYI